MKRAASMPLLDKHTEALLQMLLHASAMRPLRGTAAVFCAAFPAGGATSFHALACLLVVLKASAL